MSVCLLCARIRVDLSLFARVVCCHSLSVVPERSCHCGVVCAFTTLDGEVGGMRMRRGRLPCMRAILILQAQTQRLGELSRCTRRRLYCSHRERLAD